MRTINHTRLEPYISSARLNTYSNFFAPADQIELFGCYLWSKEIAAAFFPLLQVLEITLRNAIHKEARNALGPYWFDNVATKPQRKLSDSQHRHVQHLADSIRNARTEISRDLSMPRNATVNEDRIIAKVTFGFWTNLFSAAFDVNRNPRALWPNLLRPVFPNAPQGHRDRATMQSKLLAIKTFRNKAFHHEPIWNIGRPTGVLDAINKLQATCDDISNMIKWVSLDGLELVEKAGYTSTIRRVCSVEHLDYLRNPGANDKPYSRVKRELRAIMRQPNNTTHITLNGKNKGKILGS